MAYPAEVEQIFHESNRINLSNIEDQQIRDFFGWGILATNEVKEEDIKYYEYIHEKDELEYVGIEVKDRRFWIGSSDIRGSRKDLIPHIAQQYIIYLANKP